jgi:hypothetical protein
MNISHVCAACYQNVEISDKRPPVKYLCFDVGIQQFKGKKNISGISEHKGNNEAAFCLANQETRRAIISTATGY